MNKKILFFSSISRYALIKLQRLAVVCKALEEASKIIALMEITDMNKLTESFHRKCIENLNGLSDEIFVINREVFFMAKYLNEYFLKHQLYLNGFNFNNQHEIIDVFNELLN